MATDDEIVRRLDTMIVILKLAYADAIEKARANIRSDKANAAILDASKNWTAAAKVQAAAATAGSARSTTSKKVVELIDLGVLEKRGGGNTTEYRATGLI